MSKVLLVRMWARVSTAQAPVGVLAKTAEVTRIPLMGEVIEFEPPLIEPGWRPTQVSVMRVVWCAYASPVEARVYLASEINDAQAKDPDERAEIERRIAVAASQGWAWPHPAYPQSKGATPDRAARRRAAPKKT